MTIDNLKLSPNGDIQQNMLSISNFLNQAATQLGSEADKVGQYLSELSGLQFDVGKKITGTVAKLNKADYQDADKLPKVAQLWQSLKSELNSIGNATSQFSITALDKARSVYKNTEASLERTYQSLISETQALVKRVGSSDSVAKGLLNEINKFSEMMNSPKDMAWYKGAVKWRDALVTKFNGYLEKLQGLQYDKTLLDSVMATVRGITGIFRNLGNIFGELVQAFVRLIGLIISGVLTIIDTIIAGIESLYQGLSKLGGDDSLMDMASKMFSAETWKSGIHKLQSFFSFS